MGWPSVTQDTESTWHVASCTEVTSSQRMSTPPLPPSRPREPFNSLTGAQLVSSVVSTINHQLLFQVVISPRSSPELITSSISCTPREHSFIGTSERAWKKENSLKPEKISLPSRRITKRSESRPPKVKVKRKVWSDPFLKRSLFHIQI